MRKINLLLCICLFIFVSCSKDTTQFAGSFHLDSSNFSAPPLPGGTHQMAVKFTPSDFQEFAGKQLGEIEFYTVEIPNSIEVLIYGEGTSDSSPGDLIYQQDVSDEISRNAWNKSLLSVPYDLPDNDFWIAIRVSQSGTLPTVGCDVGPAQENGDWFLEQNSQEWETFRDNTNGGVSINWNIRAWVLE